MEKNNQPKEEKNCRKAPNINILPMESSDRLSLQWLSSREPCLRVTNLSDRIDQKRLFKIFEPYGKILSCRIMKSKNRAKGIVSAFVNYSNFEDAATAKRLLNYSRLDGLEIRICFKAPPCSSDPNANLFVGNLAQTVQARDLDELFSRFGNTVSCFIQKDENGASLGYGYVQLESESSAQKAIDALEGSEFHGSTLKVKKFVPVDERDRRKNNLYIKDFPAHWTKETIEDKLQELFGEFGAIKSTGVSAYEKNGQELFFAFVAYEEEESAVKAIGRRNGEILDEDRGNQKPLYVTYFQPKGLRQKALHKSSATNMIVKSLREDVKEDELREVFGRYGKITSLFCKVGKPTFLKPTEVMKFACINFEDPASAHDLYSSGGQDPEVQALLHPLYKAGDRFINYHQPKAERNAYLKAKNGIKEAIQKMPSHSQHEVIHELAHSIKKDGFVKQRLGSSEADYQSPLFPKEPERKKKHERVVLSKSDEYFSDSGTSKDIFFECGFWNHGGQGETHDVPWLKRNKKRFFAFHKSKQQDILSALMLQRVRKSKMVSKSSLEKVVGVLTDLQLLEYEEIIDILEDDDIMQEKIRQAFEIINENDC